MVSLTLTLISSSASTVKITTKQTTTNVLIGITVSTKSGMIKNNKSSLMIEYSNVVILLSLD